MVKKLFKHEFLAYFRILIPMHLILVILAFFGRIFQFAENESIFYALGFWAAITIYALATVALFMITQIFSIVRFYKNMFTGEGYLTLTLPVTASQHIWVKVSVAVLVQLINVVIFALSMLLLTAGEIFAKFADVVQESVSSMYAEIGFNLVIYTIEFLAILILAIFSSNLLYYSCILLGQTFHKKRIFAAVAIYFTYCVIGRIVSTIFSMFMFSNAGYELIDVLEAYFTAHPFIGVHLFFITGIVISMLVCAFFFLITRYVMNKKLNLE